jgi:glycosyltransferase involved in cell wall biosynthesis
MRLISRVSDKGSYLFFGPTAQYQIQKQALKLWARTLSELDFSVFDVLYCDHLELSALFSFAHGAVPSAVGVHNVASRYVSRQLALDGHLAQKLVLFYKQVWLLCAETLALQKPQLCFSMSQEELSWLRKRAKSKVVLAPVTIDTSYFSEKLNPAALPSAGPWLLYTGYMQYEPNADAVKWFCAEILPRIRALHPSVGLLIVGKNPPADVVSLAHTIPNVIVTGYVPDVRPYFCAANIVIVPLRLGAGVRIKIMEAMAASKAIVSSSIGFEGLPIQPGLHLLQADTPSEFANAVCSLIMDTKLRSQLEKEAAAAAVKLFDYNISLSIMESELQKLTKRETDGLDSK